ncbi:homoserine kinase [Mesorhizobium sp. IMUNJ 23033]|uniref:homoserine kinase n=1 Tax=Mesorhizobium sp. IMUNJ 23033 TaxID=3378039 RepID=UPI0038501462
MISFTGENVRRWMLSHSSIKHIETAYNITANWVESLGAGSGNSNYLIRSDRGNFVLCVIEEQSLEEVGRMVSTLEWLRANGYFTSGLVYAPGNERILVLDQKPAFLREFLEGKVVWNLSSGQLNQIGRSIASLHQLPCPGFLPTSIYYEHYQFSNALGLGVDADYEGWTKASLDRIQAQSYAGLPRGLIHGDVFCDNVLFDGERLVAIIDFELACNYYYVFDLAMAAVGVCRVDGAIEMSKVRSLVAGYESRRQLLATERGALQTFTEYAAIRTSLWRFWRYRHYDPGSPKENSFQEMVRVARHVRSIDQDEFGALIWADL